MARLSLYLLGQLQVLLDEQVVSGFESDKVRAMLVYLAVEADRPHRRETLGELLWPERPEGSALSNLRGALSNLRKTIHDKDTSSPFILATRQTIQFNPDSDHWLDVSNLTALDGSSEVGTLEEAVSVYRGPFLEGFTLKDSAAFDEWSLVKREQSGRRIASAYQQLVGHYEQSGAYEQALAHAWRWVELESIDEAAHRHLIRLLAASGQRSAALGQYEALCRILAAELDVQPSEETQALYRALLEEETTKPPPVERRQKEPDSPPIELPVEVTPFIGRDRELEQIVKRLEDPVCRLLTLTGPGGVGKTRLALRSARERTADFPSGVFFVPLAALTSPDFLVSAIAAALKFEFYGPEAPERQLLNHLLDRRALLVLDNFEHLLEGAGLLTELLAQAPGLKLLVTSRERLNLQGEWIVEVEGMNFPDEGAREDIEQYDAVQLFAQCARRVRPDFTLTEAEMPFVVRMCQFMLGMPLAIELSATWLRTLSTEQIVREVEHGLGFLSSSLRDVPERHHSLWAAFDHSWRLLSEDERAAFRRLSVFRGGFEREAAEDIAGASLPLLSALVDKSLIYRSGAGRYEINELLRQYAHSKLVESGEDEATVRRHRDWYLKRAEHIYPELWSTTESLPRLAWIRAERDNYRLALEWSIARRDAEESLRLAAALTWFWYIRADYTEGRRWLKQALAIGQDAPSALLAEVMSKAGNLAIMQRDHQEGVRLSEQGLQGLLEAGNLWEAGWALNQLGYAARQQSDYETAERLCAEGLDLFRRIRHEAAVASLLVYQGLVACYQRDYDRAASLLEEGLPVLRAAGDIVAISRAVHGLGLIALHRGELGQANSWFAESLSVVQTIGAKLEFAQSLEGLAAVACQQGQHARSCMLFGHAEQLRTTISTPLSTAEQADYDRCLSTIRANLEDEMFAETWAQGQAMTAEEAVVYALSEDGG